MLRGARATVAIKKLNANIVVETETCGDFFLQRFGDSLGHGIRRAIAARSGRGGRRANALPHRECAGRLRLCSISEARGRDRRKKRASRYWYRGRSPRLRR